MDILRSYLISLGFRVERGSERRFTETVGKTTARVAELGAALEAVGVAVAAVVTKMSDRFEDLYYASQRIGSSVENIRGFGYAISQVGGKADAAQQSLENIGEFLRSNPAGYGILKSWGIQTQTLNGELRDTSEIASDMGDYFRKMAASGPGGYNVAKMQAGIFGIDVNTLQALMRGDITRGMNEFSAASKQAGVNQQAFAVQGHAFAVAMRGVRNELTLLAERVFMSLSTKLMPTLERFSDWLQKNGPLVATRLEHFFEGVWTIATTIGQVVTNAIDVMIKLDKATGGLSTALLGLLAAWRLLNLGVLLTPIGAVIGTIVALGAAIAALVDDYQTWARGGSSLFDWSAWKGTIDAATDAFTKLAQGVVDFAKKLGDATGKELPGFVSAVGGLAKAFLDLGTALAPLGGWLVKTFGPAAIHFITSGINLITDTVEALADAVRVVADVLRGDFKAAAADAVKFGQAISRRVDTDRSRNSVPANARQSSNVELEGGPARPRNPNDRSMLQRGAAWLGGERAPSSGMPNVQSHTRGPEFANVVPMTTRSQAARVAEAMNYFMSQGWTRNQAAGLAANIKNESQFNPGSVGDSGLARGIAQWHPDRQAAFAKWAGHDLSASNYREQLEYMQYELTRGMRRNAGAHLAATKTAYAAGNLVSREYESPLDPAGQKAAMRGMDADRFSTMPVAGAGGSSVTVAPSTTININGTSDPAEAGRQAGAAVGRENADMIRATQRVVR